MESRSLRIKLLLYTSIMFQGIAGVWCDSSWCKIGWVYRESACYRFVNTGQSKFSWDISNRHCKTMGSDLTSVHSVEQQTFLWQVWQVFGEGFAFAIGLYNNTASNTFMWTDRTDYDYSNWDEVDNEPSPANRHVFMYKNPTGRWVTRQSDLGGGGYVCQMPANSQARTVTSASAIYKVFSPPASFTGNIVNPKLAIDEVQLSQCVVECVVECANRCSATNGCRGYNYGHVDQVCQLLAISVVDDYRDAILIRNDDYTHYYLRRH